MTSPNGIRVLCIEDDPGAARLVAKRLEREGFTVDVAADGETGLSMLEQARYDVVATDHRLPGMSGLEIIGLLSARGKLPPVVMFTAAGDEGIAVQAMRLGAEDYIIKDRDALYVDLIPPVIERALVKRALEAAKIQADEDLKKAHEDLERRVEERTAELASANEALQDQVTQRLAAERALRDSEQRFRALAETAPFGLSVLTADKRFEYFNSKFVEMFGYTLQDIPDLQAWVEKVSPTRYCVEGVPFQWNDSAGYDRPGPDGGPELICVRFRDGSEKRISVWKVTLDNGKEICTYQDVTFTVQAVQEIARARKEWEQTFDATPDAVMLLDNSHRILRANRAMIERFGLDMTDMEGKRCFECVHDTKIAPAFCPKPHVYLDGKEHSSEFFDELSGATYLVSTSPLRDEDGKIEGVVHVCRDITSRKKMELEKEKLIEELASARDALQFQATHDSLTNLLNRAAILDSLKKELARTRRHKTSLGIIMLDVDHFKNINDEYGHLAGDAVLREAGRIMTAQVRSYDSVGRYGGEEYLIVLPNCGTHEAGRIGGRLRSWFDSNALSTGEGMFRITVSCGVTVADGQSRPTMDAMVRAADQALYHAKHLGRNRVEFA